MPDEPVRRRQHDPLPSRRSWWWDALAALAFFGQAFVAGRFFARVNPLAGLFVLAVLGGLGWFFAKAAWRGLLEARSGGDHQP